MKRADIYAGASAFALCFHAGTLCSADIPGWARGLQTDGICLSSKGATLLPWVLSTIAPDDENSVALDLALLSANAPSVHRTVHCTLHPEYSDRLLCDTLCPGQARASAEDFQFEMGNHWREDAYTVAGIGFTLDFPACNDPMDQQILLYSFSQAYTLFTLDSYACIGENTSR